MLKSLETTPPGTWIPLFLVTIILLWWAGTPQSSFGPQQGIKAKLSATRSQIANFKTAIELYVQDNHRLPTTAQGLDALIHRPKAAPHPAHWKKYMDDLNEIPLDPWGNPYLYQAPGPHGEPYFIISYGADGVPGGRGNNADITSLTPAASW